MPRLKRREYGQVELSPAASKRLEKLHAAMDRRGEKEAREFDRDQLEAYRRYVRSGHGLVNPNIPRPY